MAQPIVGIAVLVASIAVMVTGAAAFKWWYGRRPVHAEWAYRVTVIGLAAGPIGTALAVNATELADWVLVAVMLYIAAAVGLGLTRARRQV